MGQVLHSKNVSSVIEGTDLSSVSWTQRVQENSFDLRKVL